MADFGMNLRVTMDSKQGGRKYMEDVLSVKFQKTDDGRNIEYTYLAVFDGHGGAEAAKFAKEHLLKEVTKLKGFWSDDEEEVKAAIKEGFLSTHRLMWKAVGTWPKTLTGYPSTAGTTASVVFIRNGKMYVAHVGDSTVVMGMKEQNSENDEPVALSITDDHKPDAPKELKRIEEDGGQVLAKAGVQRVVWHRPKIAQGPVRRSTNVDNIPFLAIARALGDLWSYNAENDTFVVSPEPDIATYSIDLAQHKFVILASDGLWNMVKPQEAVDIVHQLDPHSKDPYLGRKPASLLVHIALDRWSKRMLRADNTSVIVAYFDPPGSHKEPLYRTPSDLSTASTLKASSDGEEEEIEEEPELEDIFASPEPAGFMLDEESHQAGTPTARMLNKPALKRLPASIPSRPLSPRTTPIQKKLPISRIYHKPSPRSIRTSQSSPVTALAKQKHHESNSPAKVVVDSENDPNKVSIITVTVKSGNNSKKKSNVDSKRPSCSSSSSNKRTLEEDICSPAKKLRLASPESSQVCDSPLVNTGQFVESSPGCSSPLNIDLSPANSTASDMQSMISPLWPSHLADDLHSDNAMTEPIPASGCTQESIPRDVLQENCSPAQLNKLELPSSSSSSSSLLSSGSQNRSPATRATIRRLSAGCSPRLRKARLSPHTAKLSNVHRVKVLRKSSTPKHS